MIALPWFMWLMRRALRVSVLLLLVGAFAVAQSNPVEHVFQVPRSELDKAIRELNASAPGRLPILEGFVAPEVPMLEKYQRGYYQYNLEVRPAASGGTLLRVRAKITAWLTNDSTTLAGYRVLLSNGRLESDLIERLEEALHHPSAIVASEPNVSATTKQDRAPTEKAGSGDASVFRAPLPLAQPANRADMTLPSAQELAQQKRVQQLTEQRMNLEEILRNQARPKDLAAVLKTGTPVYARPAEISDVLFRADAEDEFKVLDVSESWVHVQVSGISRGWIRKSALEMNADAGSVAEVESSRATASPEAKAHEETSLFPGDWAPLRGRMVRITWVRPESGGPLSGTNRWLLARSVFRDTFNRISRTEAKIEGVVIVIDSPEGGMIAATSNALQRWNTGEISDSAFRKGCWADPPEALDETGQSTQGTDSRTQ